MRLPKPAWTAGHRMWLQVTNARNTRPTPDHAAACATRGGAGGSSLEAANSTYMGALRVRSVYAPWGCSRHFALTCGAGSRAL
jgi:hypothetical protein